MGFNKRDMAQQYRAHAQAIADDDIPRPVKAYLIEFDASGRAFVASLGMSDDHARELIQNAASAIQGLTNLIASCNVTQAT